MPFSTFASTLHDARTQWLGGDAQAWARYTECCLQLEAEHRSTLKSERPLQANIPTAWHPASAPATQAVRQ